MREDLKKRRFIDNFAIELTNTTLPERMRIAEKYYNEFKREQDRRIYLEDYFIKLEREIKELKKVEICYKENLALCKWQEKLIYKLATALEKIRDCATTEMTEIVTREDYNGFLALKAISAKVKQVLKEIQEGAENV